MIGSPVVSIPTGLPHPNINKKVTGCQYVAQSFISLLFLIIVAMAGTEQRTLQILGWLTNHMGYVADRVSMGQVSAKYFSFPCQFLFHQLLHGHRRHHHHPNHQTSGAAPGELLLQRYLLLMALLPCLMTSSVILMTTGSFCVLLIPVSSLQISALFRCIRRSSFKEYSTVLDLAIAPTFL